MKNLLYYFLIIFLISSINIFAQNWFPLELGNKWHYTVREDNDWQGTRFYSYFFSSMKVTDTVMTNNQKYFSINGFRGFPNGTLVRYDEVLSHIIILINNVEHIYMDFSLPDSTILIQVQPNQQYIPVMIISKWLNFLDDSVYAKGFYIEDVPPRYVEKGWYYFSPGIGFINQVEKDEYWGASIQSLSLIEYILYLVPPDSVHIKHNYLPEIEFIPILFIPDSTNLKQDFKINHHYSVLTLDPLGYIFGRTYIDKAYLDSYYSNEVDTIYNSNYHLTPLSEVNFSLNFPIDTNLYNQGYYLYYRIVVKDKSLLPTYFYEPGSSYYKLYWRDSTTTSVKQNIIIDNFYLEQNYPNPFNPSTTISWQSQVGGWQVLKVYDALGNEVANLVDEFRSAGSYMINFDASKLSSGVYFYKLSIGNEIKTNKMILLR